MRANQIEVPAGKATNKNSLQLLIKVPILFRRYVCKQKMVTRYTILRLALYYYVLNPIEMIKGTIKKAIQRHNT